MHLTIATCNWKLCVLGGIELAEDIYTIGSGAQTMWRYSTGQVVMKDVVCMTVQQII